MNQNYGGYVGQQPGMRPPYMQVSVKLNIYILDLFDMVSPFTNLPLKCYLFNVYKSYIE